MKARETPGMRKYGESKTTRIMMATVPHVASGSGLRKFQADGFFFRQSVPLHINKLYGTCTYSRLPEDEPSSLKHVADILKLQILV